MRKLMLISVGLLLTGAVSLRAADAKDTYDAQHCAMCHGADGKGKTRMGGKLGVKDWTDAKVQEGLKDADMIKVIKEGAKQDDETKMKAYSDLSDDEVKALVAYIRAFKK